MTKALTCTETPKKQSDNTKTPPKTSITQQIHTNLGKSVEVTTSTKKVWLNRFTGSQPSHQPQKLCNQKDTHLKFVNCPPYKDRGPTTNRSGEAIKIITQISEAKKKQYTKNIKTSARVGYTPPVRKRAQVQGLKESQLPNRGDKDQGLVSPEEASTSPVI